VSCPNGNFGALLRHWRNVRRVSQLDLALEADISTRHLSCIETGRSQPSRDMVVRLTEALQIPLRERNTLLLAAGFAPLYPHTGLETPELEAARRAVELLLAQLEPNPVLVLDRHWNTLRMNAGAKRFLALFPRLRFWDASQWSPPGIPAPGAAALHRKLGTGGGTHYSSLAA